MDKRFLAAALAGVVALTATTTALRAATSGAPVVIDAILPLTGSGAFIGVKKVQTLDMIAAYVNRTGGIQGRPLKFNVHDDGSNPEIGVQLTSALVANHATAILGSVLAGICKAAFPLVDKTGPLTYCYTPNIETPPNSYMFSATLGIPDTITKMLQYFKARGWKRIATIATTDASGEDFDRPFTAALQRQPNGIMQVAHERFNGTDISVAAQVARIKAAAPDVVMVQAVGPSFGTVLRNLNDAGVGAVVFGAAGNLSYAQLGGYKSFIHEVYFVTAGGAAPVPAAAPQQRKAQEIFFREMAAQKIRPEYLYADTWDPPMLIVEALRKRGPDATSTQIRDYIDGLSEWWGVSGIYNFRLRPQRGLGFAAAVVDHYDAAKDEITEIR